MQRLVGAARLGDGQAARRLYTLHAGRVFRAVRGLCASEQDAEDAMQEAFAAALPKLDEYRYRPGTRFVAWLCTIAFNVARRRGKVAGRTAPLSAAVADAARAEAEDLDAALDLSRRRDDLLAALAELPARDREVMSLRYGGGLAAPEVAEALGLSAANVRKICERQRAALLLRLGGEGGSAHVG